MREGYRNDSAAETATARPIATVIAELMPGTAVVFVGSTRSSGSEDLGNPAVRAAAATRFGVMLVILLLRTVI